MAELKHTFTSGRMDKDRDERLIENGSYRDALNVHVSSSEGSDVGAVENLKGNVKLSTLDLSSPKTIGSIAYTEQNKIYWLVTSNRIDGIYEYDQANDVINPILIDTKNRGKALLKDVLVEANDENELSLDNIVPSELSVLTGRIPQEEGAEVTVINNLVITSEDPKITVSIPKGTVLRMEDEKYVFKNSHYSGQSYGNVNLTFEYTSEGVLNFSKKHLVTGINIIDDMLFWTDNLNVPRKINIPKFKKWTAGLFNTQTIVTYITKDENGNTIENTRDFNEEDLSVAKRAPMSAPSVDLYSTLAEGNIQATRAINFYTDYNLNLTKDWQLAFDTSRIQNINTNTTNSGGDGLGGFSGSGYNFDIDVDLDFSNLDFSNISNLDLSENDYNQLQSDVRAKHGNRAMEPGDQIEIVFGGEVPDWKEGDIIEVEEQNAADGKIALEATMLVKRINTVSKKITLELITKNISFENKSYTVTMTLKEGDPIYEKTFVRFGYRWKYKDGEYSTISPFSEPAFIPQDFTYDQGEPYNKGMENDLRKIVLKDFELGTDNVDEIEVLYKEARNQNIYTLKSQKKIDFPSTYEITKKQIHSLLPNDQLLRAWDNVPKKAKAQDVTANRIIYGNYTQGHDVYNDVIINPSVVKREGGFKRTVKSNRSYQIGVSYIDEYNRHTPILSNDTGAIKVPMDQSATTNQFEISLKNNPPAWAKYFKYYIKDVSQEYYNLAADNIYRDEDSGFAYIAFPSVERNKITEDSYIFLKKLYNSNEPVFENNKFKVIDITAEPPEFISKKTKQIAALDQVEFTDAYGNGTAVTQRGTGTPRSGQNTIFIESIGDSQDGITADDAAFLKVGNLISFGLGGPKTSNKYKISSVRFHTEGVTEAEIKIEKEFGDDVELIYEDSGPTASIPYASGESLVNMYVFEEEDKSGSKEFDGRFFVKVKDAFNVLSDNIEKVDNIEYIEKDSYKASGSRAIMLGVRARKKTPKLGGAQLSMHVEYNAGANWFRVEEMFLHQDDSILDSFKLDRLLKIKSPGFSEEENNIIYRIRQVKKEKAGKNNWDVREVSLTSVDEDPDDTFNVVDIQSKLPKPGEFKEIEFVFVEEKTSANDTEEQVFSQNPAVFETEPIENTTELDLYYETEKAFHISAHGAIQRLKWYNAFAFGNGVESNRIRDDFNETFISTGVKASTSISGKIEEEHKSNGIIWSGIVNGRTGVNESNQFNQANPITKDFLPSYGAVQKLHALDNYLVVLCEDKILRALANKAVLYNADGNPNVVATNRVIDDAQPYLGDYGISTNPESFASSGFRYYFTDKKRGVVLRGSRDGIEVVSRYLMSDFFNDRFFDSGCYNSTVDNSIILGTYDDYNDLYNVSFIGRDTVCFDDRINGWSTRKSFIPENGISLNNRFYTYNTGEIWEHDNANVPYNNFYGTQYKSSIELEINDNPSVIKNYKTIGYEGSKAWTAKIKTDQQNSSSITFKEKENKYFAVVNGEKRTLQTINPKNFNFQGIGKAKSITEIDDAADTTLKFELSPKTTDKYTSQTITYEQAPGVALSNTVSILLKAKPGYKLNASAFNLNKVTASQSGDDILLKYTHGIKTQPTKNTKRLLELCKINFADKKQVTVSGNYTVKLTNITADVNDGSYSVSGNSKVLRTITKRTLTPVEGYKLSLSDIKDNNPNVKLRKRLNKNGSVTITERIVIPNINTTNLDYEITAIASVEDVNSKKISSLNVDKTPIREGNEKRIIQVQGDPGAVFSYTAKQQGESTDLDHKINQKINAFGFKNIDIDWPLGNTAATFEVIIAPEDNTEIADDVESTQEVDRPAIETKKITIFGQWNDVVSTKSVIQGFTYDSLDRKFTCKITLPAETYVIKKQPKQTDFSFENTVDDITLKDLKISESSNTLTLEGRLDVTELTTDNKLFIALDDFIAKEVTLTIGYNTQIQGGANTTDYSKTAPVTNPTIDGTSETKADAEDEYLFTLTASSGYEFIPTIDGDDFEIIDGSTSVTSTYALNGRMKVVLEDDKMKVGFITKPFDLPSNDKTIEVRPKVAITRVEQIDPEFSVLYTFNDAESRSYTDTTLQGTLEDDTDESFLFQKVFKIDRESDDSFKKTFKSTGHTITYLDDEISAGTSGTYEDINGDDVTITGQIDLNDKSTKLTLNTLANISDTPAKKIGRVLIELETEETAFLEYYLKEGGCFIEQTEDDSIRVKVFNPDPTATDIQLGARVVRYDEDELGVTNGSNVLTGTYKIYGTDMTLTLSKNSAIDIDKVHEIAVCPPPKKPIIVLRDIIKTFNDPDFKLSASSNSKGTFTYTIANADVATVDGDTVTITGAGDTVITATQNAYPGFTAASVKARLRVNKDELELTATDIEVLSSADDFDITINQPE